MCNSDYISETLTDMGRCYTFNYNQENVLSSSETGDLFDMSRPMLFLKIMCK